jgi:hypothetical protein
MARVQARVVPVGVGATFCVLLLLSGCQKTGESGDVVGQLGQISPQDMNLLTSSTLPATLVATSAAVAFEDDGTIPIDAPTTEPVGSTAPPIPESQPSTVVAIETTVPATLPVPAPVLDFGDNAVVAVESVPVTAPAPAQPAAAPAPRPAAVPATAPPVAPPTSSFARVTRVTIPFAAAQPSDAAIIGTVDIRGTAVPVLEGWTAYATPDSVALDTRLNPTAQSVLYEELKNDPTRVLFVADDEMSIPQPTTITVIVRSNVRLTAAVVVDRLVAKAVADEKYALQGGQQFRWSGLTAHQSWLRKADGTNRFVAAATTSTGRLTIIEAVGTRADLAQIEQRLIVEVNPLQP